MTDEERRQEVEDRVGRHVLSPEQLMRMAGEFVAGHAPDRQEIGLLIRSLIEDRRDRRLMIVEIGRLKRLVEPPELTTPRRGEKMDDSIEAMRARSEKSIVWAPGTLASDPIVNDALWRAARDRRWLLEMVAPWSPTASEEATSAFEQLLAKALFAAGCSGIAPLEDAQDVIKYLNDPEAAQVAWEQAPTLDEAQAMDMAVEAVHEVRAERHLEVVPDEAVRLWCPDCGAPPEAPCDPSCSQPGRAPCPIPSSITDKACTLPAGHPPDSPSRFHRYAPPDHLTDAEQAAGLDGK